MGLVLFVFTIYPFFLSFESFYHILLPQVISSRCIFLYKNSRNISAVECILDRSMVSCSVSVTFSTLWLPDPSVTVTGLLYCPKTHSFTTPFGFLSIYFILPAPFLTWSVKSILSLRCSPEGLVQRKFCSPGQPGQPWRTCGSCNSSILHFLSV